MSEKIFEIEKNLSNNLITLKPVKYPPRSSRWKTMHTAIQVANTLLALADRANRPLTPMQLIKLVYLCQGWMLGLKGRSLIQDPVEAWAYGPVIPELYRAVKKYKADPVADKLPIANEDQEFDAEEKDIIGQTFSRYGGFNGPALSRLTHQPGSPWSITRKKRVHNAPISNELIQDHFQDLALKNVPD